MLKELEECPPDQVESHRLVLQDLINELGPLHVSVSPLKFGSRFPDWLLTCFTTGTGLFGHDLQVKFNRKPPADRHERRWSKAALTAMCAFVAYHLKPETFTSHTDYNRVKPYILAALPVRTCYRLLGRDCMVFESGRDKEKVEAFLRWLAQHTNSTHIMGGESATVFRTKGGGYRGLLIPKIKQPEPEVKKERPHLVLGQPTVVSTLYPILGACPDCNGEGTVFDNRYGGRRTCVRCAGTKEIVVAWSDGSVADIGQES